MAGLIGRNGAGKTTLMKSIMGLLKPSRGGIDAFDDTDLLAVKTHARTALGIGYMPEDRRLIPDLTCEENMLVPAWAVNAPDAARGWSTCTRWCRNCASSRRARACSSPAASRSWWRSAAR